MSNKENILDKGHVELVSHMGSDLTVVNAARVSFSNESNFEIDHGGMPCLSVKDGKLIRYLAKHNHWTPFAHPQITLRIKAPISIRTQFFKHKQGFVENEVSRRYVDDEPEFYYPEPFRHRPTNGMKQGSDGVLECRDGGGETSGGFATHPLYEGYRSLMKSALRCYEDLIASNVAPEQARFCLPQAMYTEWFWTGSLAAYARFYKQRIDDHAQWEIQQYAEAVGKIIQPLFPVSWSELTK